VENRDDVRSVYTNHARVLMTQWDMRFTFAEIIAGEIFVDGKPQPQLRVELRSEVVMTPAHAKAFAKALQGQLDAYEKIAGEIKIIDPTGAAK